MFSMRFPYDEARFADHKIPKTSMVVDFNVNDFAHPKIYSRCKENKAARDNVQSSGRPIPNPVMVFQRCASLQIKLTLFMERMPGTKRHLFIN